MLKVKWNLGGLTEEKVRKNMYCFQLLIKGLPPSSLICVESKNLSPLLWIHYFSAFGTYLYIADLKKTLLNMTTDTLLEENAELCLLLFTGILVNYEPVSFVFSK